MILSLGSHSGAGLLSLVVAWVAMLAYGLAALTGGGERRWPAVAWQLGWLAHGVALVIDFAALDEPHGAGARFGFAPVLSITAWLVLTVHAIESRFVPLPQVRRVLAALGALVVLVAVIFPGEPHPLASSPWVPLHWMLGVASYGLFGAAVLHASMLDSADRQLRLKAGSAGTGPFGMPLLRLERLTFRFVDAGFVVLTATLLLGAWSTAQWHWSHKTVFSLLGWAVFAALIVGRHLWGWRGRRATRWLYTGAVLLLLAYVGYRFVLEVLLHRSA
ncbi:cytochrome C assembly family protein [Ideonella sp. BN130291]|uniref:cytochrome C assembly family protein n=1 Tax=Ideonella sp. BN130291 TaxID=3112940 RepID=UPI002E2600D1|nr:cytochrome c biogenesis protein CcsA [Ideonella sp. BN130291]